MTVHVQFCKYLSSPKSACVRVPFDKLGACSHHGVPVSLAVIGVARGEKRHVLKKPTQSKKYNALPVKPARCWKCDFVARTGQDELQQHLDKQHPGWVQQAIHKLPNSTSS